MGRDFDIDYTEGLKVGYKWFDAENKEPLFAFGDGLSYTTFAYSGLKAGLDGVSFTVRNTGQRAGAEIAQVYVGLPAAAQEPPKRRWPVNPDLLPGHQALGRFRGGGRQRGVDLGDLRSGALAGVANGERHAIQAGLEPGVRERGVREAMAEGEQRLFVLGIEPLVAHLQAFGVVDIEGHRPLPRPALRRPLVRRRRPARLRRGWPEDAFRRSPDGAGRRRFWQTWRAVWRMG